MEPVLYNVGDVVWYSSFRMDSVESQCPVCYGDKSVIVILGNRDQVRVECDYCGKGYEGAKGYITEYVKLPKAEQFTITKRRVEDGVDGVEVEYFSGNYLLNPENIFSSENIALAHAERLAIEERERDLNAPKFKNLKSYSWNAGYHLKNAKRCREEAMYHEQKAQICKSRSTKGE